jgi:hypothetical protein
MEPHGQSPWSLHEISAYAQWVLKCFGAKVPGLRRVIRQ